jgi:hypothetical protein
MNNKLTRIIKNHLIGEREFNPNMNMTDQQINDLVVDVVGELTEIQ